MRRFKSGVAKALFLVSGGLPCRIIADVTGPYLERYYLVTVFGVRFYLHRFVASDPGRGLHDHPWPWAGSVVLSGFYFEITRAGVRTVRWINGLVGDSFHRVVLPNEHGQPWDMEGAPLGAAQPCWTLFFHRAKYVKPWGFFRPITEGQEPSSAKQWLPHNFPGDGEGAEDPWWLRVPIGRFEDRRLGAANTSDQENER